MDNFMRRNNINNDLKGRSLKYLEFLWKLEKKNLEKEQSLLDQLPESLKHEILLEANGKCLNQFLILKNNFSQEVVEKLSLKLKKQQYSPKEQIYMVK